jgi:hypothetical protein
MQNHIRSTVKYIKKKDKKMYVYFTCKTTKKKKKHNSIYTIPTKLVALHEEKKQSNSNC